MIPPMAEPITAVGTMPVKKIDAAVDAMATPVEAMATPVEAMATPVLDMVNPVLDMVEPAAEEYSGNDVDAFIYAEYDYYGEDHEEYTEDYDMYAEEEYYGDELEGVDAEVVLDMVEPAAEDLDVVYEEYDYYGEDFEEHPEDYDMYAENDYTEEYYGAELDVVYAEYDYYGEEDVEEAAEPFDVHNLDWSWFCSDEGHDSIPMVFEEIDVNGDGTISATEALQEDMMEADELAFILAH